MKKAVLPTLAAFLLVTYGTVTQADEECIFTSPEASSPMDVLDSAVYLNFGFLGYRLVQPPVSFFSYAAETNEEDEDDRRACVLAAATISLKPFHLVPERQSAFEMDIRTYAEVDPQWLPWPCPETGWCLATGESTVAASRLDINDLDVAFFIARYLFVITVWP